MKNSAERGEHDTVKFLRDEVWENEYLHWLANEAASELEILRARMAYIEKYHPLVLKIMLESEENEKLPDLTEKHKPAQAYSDER